MAQVGGQWGNAVWGGSLWGCRQYRAVATGTLTTQALIDAINQQPAVAIEVALSVEIDGVDYTGLIETISGAHEGIARATVVLIGTGAGVSKFDPITINETITVVGIGSATGCIFRGSVQTVTESEGVSSQSTTLTCYGDLYNELNEVPVNTTWSGTGSDLVLSECAGYAVDVSIPALTLADQTINYSSKMALIKAIAGTSGTPLVYVDRNGTLTVRTIEYGGLRRVEWAVPLSAQTWQGPASDALSHCNRLTIQGNNGTVETVNDAADQALHGVITGTGLVMPLTDDSATLIAKGQAEIARSIRDSFVFEMPLHPFVSIGDVLTSVAKVDGTHTGTVLVEAVTSWSYTVKSGGWMRLRVSEVAV